MAPNGTIRGLKIGNKKLARAMKTIGQASTAIATHSSIHAVLFFCADGSSGPSL
jgi:hypothetical protein